MLYTFTKEEFKKAHNNIMTVMENHIMMIAHIDRQTANLVANEVLDLDREADRMIEEEKKYAENLPKCDKETCYKCPYFYGDADDCFLMEVELLNCTDIPLCERGKALLKTRLDEKGYKLEGVN